MFFLQATMSCPPSGLSLYLHETPFQQLLSWARKHGGVWGQGKSERMSFSLSGAERDAQKPNRCNITLEVVRPGTRATCCAAQLSPDHRLRGEGPDKKVYRGKWMDREFLSVVPDFGMTPVKLFPQMEGDRLLVVAQLNLDDSKPVQVRHHTQRYGKTQAPVPAPAPVSAPSTSEVMFSCAGEDYLFNVPQEEAFKVVLEWTRLGYGK